MPRTNLNQKVITTTKSPKHDELIFVVFRRRFCDMSAQKWAILTWLILFRYQYGSNVAKHKTQPQNTTHNTQHTQHTQQPTNMSRCHPTPSGFALSLSVGRAAVPPNHCAAAPHHHTQVASHRAYACCCWFTHLGGWNKRHRIIERGGCLGLRWPLFDCNKQQSTNSWWQR